MTSQSPPEETPKFVQLTVPATWPTPEQLAGFHITWRDWTMLKTRIDRTPPTNTDYLQKAWGFFGVALPCTLSVLGILLQQLSSQRRLSPTWSLFLYAIPAVLSWIIFVIYYRFDQTVRSHTFDHIHETLDFMEAVQPEPSSPSQDTNAC